MPASWYTLYTKPRCEGAVGRRLRAKGFETYLPAVTVDGYRGHRDEHPFFPCYLFVRVDPSTDGLSSVRWTSGLKYIVSFGEKPAVVPDEVVALIQERLATMEEGAGGLSDHGFRRGDRVRIRSGPFADLEAVFEEALKPDERALVLISFLGRLSEVEVAVEDLEGGSRDD